MSAPGYCNTPARSVRATIDNGMTHATDENLKVIFATANELATAAAADWRGGTPQWIEGAAFAYGSVFCRLLDEMPLPKLQTFMEAVADEVAPIHESVAVSNPPF